MRNAYHGRTIPFVQLDFDASEFRQPVKSKLGPGQPRRMPWQIDVHRGLKPRQSAGSSRVSPAELPLSYSIPRRLRACITWIRLRNCPFLF
jgi:hypothetical protein